MVYTPLRRIERIGQAPYPLVKAYVKFAKAYPKMKHRLSVVGYGAAPCRDNVENMLSDSFIAARRDDGVVYIIRPYANDVRQKHDVGYGYAEVFNENGWPVDFFSPFSFEVPAWSKRPNVKFVRDAERRIRF